MEISVLFGVIVGLFTVYFLYSYCTKQGRLELVKLITNAKEVNEALILPSTEFEPKIGTRTTQDLKVYRCVHENGSYYFLESTQKSLGGFTRHYIKITPEILAALQSIK